MLWLQHRLMTLVLAPTTCLRYRAAAKKELRAM